MTWKPKKPDTIDATSLEMFWEKWGTWISGAVALVLAGVLVYVLIQRWYDSQAAKGRGELENIRAEDPTAKMHLARLARDYGSTPLGPAIQIKLAEALYHEGDYAGVEKTLAGLRGNAAVTPLNRAAADLLLAYAAEEQGNVEEARARYKVVEDDGLYIDEAKHMLGVLDRKPKASVSPAAAVPASEAPKAPETPK